MISGIGVDLIEVDRVEEKLKRTPGLKEKLFTSLEIAYCESKHSPALHYAARFAAKEAFMKALGTGWSGGVKFSEVEIRNLETGQPVLELFGRAKEIFESKGLSRAHVSLSHLKTYAVAIVILEK
ncbi:MAG: holo-ACP synthase [Candidatus Saccharicenans sp.]